jgi:hypothetical protein
MRGSSVLDSNVLVVGGGGAGAGFKPRYARVPIAPAAMMTTTITTAATLLRARLNFNNFQSLANASLGLKKFRTSLGEPRSAGFLIGNIRTSRWLFRVRCLPVPGDG